VVQKTNVQALIEITVLLKYVRPEPNLSTWQWSTERARRIMPVRQW